MIRGSRWKIVSFTIYGAALILLYLVSTLYHSLRGRAKDVFRKLDHCAIYLLIAGSCTVGMVFYATDQKLRHGHGLWHLFVLGGSACHFAAVLFYVA